MLAWCYGGGKGSSKAAVGVSPSFLLLFTAFHCCCLRAAASWVLLSTALGSFVVGICQITSQCW